MKNFQAIADSLKFPALMRMGSTLVAAPVEMLKVANFKSEKSGRISYSGSAKGKESGRFRWLIGMDGMLRRFEDIDYVGEFPRPLKWLRKIINFERVICKIGPPEAITVGQLRTLVNPMKRREFGRYLVAFLKDYEDDEPFTAQMFRAFMKEDTEGEA